MLDTMKTELTAKYDQIKNKLQQELETQMEVNRRQKEELDEMKVKFENSDASKIFKKTLSERDKQLASVKKTLEEAKKDRIVLINK